MEEAYGKALLWVKSKTCNLSVTHRYTRVHKLNINILADKYVKLKK